MNSQHIDPALVAAAQNKLRHWIVDYTGVFPDATTALPWAIAMESVASEIRSNAAKMAAVTSIEQPIGFSK